MFEISECSQYLPDDEEIESLLQLCFGKYILKTALAQLKIPTHAKADTSSNFEMLEALGERLWELIHTGQYSDVPENIRRAYAWTHYLKIIYMLAKSTEIPQLEQAVETLDKIKLLGVTGAYAQSEKLHALLEDYLNMKLSGELKFDLPNLRIEIKPLAERQCDINILTSPSRAEFFVNHFEPQLPVLLQDYVKHWPAIEKWRNLNYLLELGGHRNVPVEIGSHYADQDWSQRLIKLKDFLKRQFGSPVEEPTEYLAQHELFQQIPALSKDFEIPEFCNLGAQILETDIKAWLGPKGTVSPLHFDAKHNLLCQVFGSKTVILAAPSDSENLYAYESRFLKNTSQILDIENIDYTEFPAARNVKFLKVPLIEGSALYIPPNWWHYVRSETASFSVSFWFK